MFELLLEDNIITSIYNVVKSNKERCDYQCGQKFLNDKFLQPKVNVCKANCDVVWEKQYINQVQAYIAQHSNELNSELLADIRNRLDVAKKRLLNARNRLIKTKLTLRKVLYGKRAVETLNMPKQIQAYER